jgi:hypothetical protein
MITTYGNFDYHLLLKNEINPEELSLNRGKKIKNVE